MFTEEGRMEFFTRLFVAKKCPVDAISLSWLDL